MVLKTLNHNKGSQQRPSCLLISPAPQHWPLSTLRSFCWHLLLIFDTPCSDCYFSSYPFQTVHSIDFLTLLMQIFEVEGGASLMPDQLDPEMLDGQPSLECPCLNSRQWFWSAVAQTKEE